MAVPISVLNFFHMFVYAWGEYRPGRLETLKASDISAPIDFLASLLCEATQEILRGSLAKRHGIKSSRMRAVRGKIDVTRSVLLPDFEVGQLICHYPYLEVNGIENQILKATFKAILSDDSINKKIREQATSVFRSFKDVTDLPLSKRSFRRVQLDRSMKRYRFPLALCELIFDQIFVADGKGARWFIDYTNDEVAMRKLFEAFVRNFLQSNLGSKLSVRSKRFSPVGLNVDPSLRSLIPSMQTDVSIYGPKRALIIDTKFTGRMFQERFGAKRIRSDHFYQIQAYVMHESIMNPSLSFSGMILYPKSERDFEINLSTYGTDFSVCTLDLSVNWDEIESNLLILVNDRIY